MSCKTGVDHGVQQREGLREAPAGDRRERADERLRGAAPPVDPGAGAHAVGHRQDGPQRGGGAEALRARLEVPQGLFEGHGLVSEPRGAKVGALAASFTAVFSPKPGVFLAKQVV